ncbi:MAG: response regulator transcription factor [Aurantimonas endophytica]|uniref:response regulator transcription factor n=1 Tax=Aurantimonas endophytica TaxID=1522175 RepID=UPI003002B59E
MAEKITVVVIDDHSLFRTGVVRSLALDDAIDVVAEGSSAADALALARKHNPSVILLDISMPGGGIEAAAQIALLPCSPKIVMLTVSESDDDVMRALDAGAVGYLLKGVDAQELITAIRIIAQGQSFVSASLTLKVIASMRERTKEKLIDHLSPQEEKVLRHVATGLSNREVAERLNILEKTVKFHMTKTMRKLNTRNRVEATLIARKEWGLS